MSDPGKSEAGHTLTVQLTLNLGRRPITGQLRTERGTSEEFTGWLGFVEAVNRAYEQLNQGPPNPRENSDDPNIE